jgi:hypothetical protein
MATNNATNNRGLAGLGDLNPPVDDKLVTPSLLPSMVSSFAWQNLGMSLSGGVLTLHSGSGAPLSATNYATVYLPSRSNVGREIRYVLTSNFTLNESDLTNNRFNTQSGVAWNEDIAFFVYITGNTTDSGASVIMGVSPNKIQTPVAANIGVPAAANANGTDRMFLWSGTAVTHASCPLVCIGSFRARKNASNQWTIQALDNQDGVGRFQTGRTFNMALGQFFAGTYFTSGGFPTFTTQSMNYKITKNGFCRLSFSLVGDGGGAGSGANEVRIFMPLEADFSQGGSTFRRGGVGTALISASGGIRMNITYNIMAGQQRFGLYRSDVNNALLTHVSFPAGNREIIGTLDYQIQT